MFGNADVSTRQLRGLVTTKTSGLNKSETSNEKQGMKKIHDNSVK